jgi:hypothetical protein
MRTFRLKGTLGKRLGGFLLSDYLIWFAGAGGFLALAWVASRTSVAEGRRVSTGRRPASTGIYRGIHYRTLPGRIEALIDGTVAARFASVEELREAVDTALEPAD